MPRVAGKFAVRPADFYVTAVLVRIMRYRWIRRPAGAAALAPEGSRTHGRTASGEQQQSATAHDTRVAGANLAYATPEKQTVEDHHPSAATVAKPLDGARRTWTTQEYRPLRIN